MFHSTTRQSEKHQWIELERRTIAKKATFDTFLSVCKPNTFRDMVKWGHSREQKMRICYCNLRRGKEWQKKAQ